ncbi:MAG: carbohydrate-binding family 9-like protein [Bryobacteraceae bacterium]
MAVFAIAIACAQAADVIQSRYSAHDFALTADASAPQWKNAAGVLATKDSLGRPVPGFETEFRSRWTRHNLYILFICPFDRLNLKPNPSTTTETDRLWNWDVAEAFLGSEFDHTGHYKEFEVSPQGEWVDLDIDRDHAGKQLGETWNSGFTVKARVDDKRKIWYGEMKIPLASIDSRKPQVGREMRAGLYRMTGVEPRRLSIAWQPTMSASFHVPAAFGILRMVK